MSGPIGLQTRLNKDKDSHGPVIDSNPAFDVFFLKPEAPTLSWVFTAQANKSDLGMTNAGTFVFKQAQEFTILAPFDIVISLTGTTLTEFAHTWSTAGFANTRFGYEKIEDAEQTVLATTPTPVVDSNKLTITVLEDWVYDPEHEDKGNFELHFTISVQLKTNNLDADTSFTAHVSSTEGNIMHLRAKTESSKLKIKKPADTGDVDILVGFGKDPELPAEIAKGVGIYSNPLHCADHEEFLIPGSTNYRLRNIDSGECALINTIKYTFTTSTWTIPASDTGTVNLSCTDGAPASHLRFLPGSLVVTGLPGAHCTLSEDATTFQPTYVCTNHDGFAAASVISFMFQFYADATDKECGDAGTTTYTSDGLTCTLSIVSSSTYFTKSSSELAWSNGSYEHLLSAAHLREAAKGHHWNAKPEAGKF